MTDPVDSVYLGLRPIAAILGEANCPTLCRHNSAPVFARLADNRTTTPLTYTFNIRTLARVQHSAHDGWSAQKKRDFLSSKKRRSPEPRCVAPTTTSTASRQFIQQPTAQCLHSVAASSRHSRPCNITREPLTQFAPEEPTPFQLPHLLQHG